MDSEEDIFGDEKRRRIQASDEEEEEEDGVVGVEEGNENASDDGLDGLGLSDEDEVEDDSKEYAQETTREIRVLEEVIPRFPRSHDKEPGSDTFFTRVPAFLTVDPKPFDSQRFLKSVESGSSVAESQKIRLQNENTIRWRYAKEGEGKVTKQSNARFVKWSDGSYSLQVGEEMFDVAVQTPYEQHFLCLSYPESQMLHTQSLLNKTMSIRPSSTQSETHKRLTAELARRAQNQSSLVQSVATLDNPEKRQQEAERAEGQLLKARRKLEAKQRQQEERLGGSGGVGTSREASYSMMEEERIGGSGGRYRNEEYEEDDFVVEEEEEGEEGEGADEDEEEEDEELDALERLEEGISDDEADRKRAERLNRAKRGEAETEEEAEGPRKKVRRVINDEDDDEEE